MPRSRVSSSPPISARPRTIGAPTAAALFDTDQDVTVISRAQAVGQPVNILGTTVAYDSGSVGGKPMSLKDRMAAPKLEGKRFIPVDDLDDDDESSFG